MPKKYGYCLLSTFLYTTNSASQQGEVGTTYQFNEEEMFMEKLNADSSHLEKNLFRRSYQITAPMFTFWRLNGAIHPASEESALRTKSATDSHALTINPPTYQ
jgi:hypothetical protein